jgi:hypothetical protein
MYMSYIWCCMHVLDSYFLRVVLLPYLCLTLLSLV